MTTAEELLVSRGAIHVSISIEGYCSVWIDVYSKDPVVLDTLTQAFGGKIRRHGKYTKVWAVRKRRELYAMLDALPATLYFFVENYCEGESRDEREEAAYYLLGQMGSSSKKLASFAHPLSPQAPQAPRNAGMVEGAPVGGCAKTGDVG